MNFENAIQFLDEEDGSVYFYDEKQETWKKISDIKSPADLPLSIRKQVREAKNEADFILSMPL